MSACLVCVHLIKSHCLKFSTVCSFFIFSSLFQLCNFDRELRKISNHFGYTFTIIPASFHRILNTCYFTFAQIWIQAFCFKHLDGVSCRSEIWVWTTADSSASFSAHSVLIPTWQQIIIRHWCYVCYGFVKCQTVGSEFGSFEYLQIVLKMYVIMNAEKNC